ncbi:MAG: hypothetical protein FWH08_03880 [Oscillospiraceae bacterium]|nr:hypothetical protein [Oscillospiraceae bacterium]
MKRFMIALLCVIFALGMVGCSESLPESGETEEIHEISGTGGISEELEQTDEPQEAAPAPIAILFPNKAPSLDVSLITGTPIQSVKAIQLTTSWFFFDEDGNGSGFESDSPHALQLRPEAFDGSTLRLDSGSGEIELNFSDNYPPQTISVQRWSAEYVSENQDIADVLGKSELVEVSGNKIPIIDGGNDYIYEIYAKWTEGNATGSSWYTFRVSAAEPVGIQKEQTQANAYFTVFEKLFEKDLALNDESTYLAVDLTDVKLTETEPLTRLIQNFCDERGFTLLLDTPEGLKEKGYINDSFPIYFEDGFLISFKDIELKQDKLVTSASKWRSGLGAFGADYTVKLNENTWEITKTENMWIS